MTEALAGIITPLIVGVMLIILGIINMTGNISSIHSYHRSQVTEENRKPFGKRVGLGTLLIGIGILIFGGMMFLAERFENDIFVFAGMVILSVAFVVGLALSFAAMKKYNGGIFRF